MNTTTHDAAPLSTAPFPREDARSIARAFLPKHVLGNRYDYYYTLTKLRTDPLYPGVLQALRPTTAPVLDLGCGLGLLAHALRADGQALPFYGVDIDDDGNVVIDMTLTSPACPLTDRLEYDTQTVLEGLVNSVRINWVWLPPWGLERITDDGRTQLQAIGFNV